MSLSACVQRRNTVCVVSCFSAEVMITVAGAKICCWFKLISEIETPFGKIRSVSDAFQE